MMISKPKQCSKCPDGVLRPLWKSNPPLCKSHAHAENTNKRIEKSNMKGGINDKDDVFYKFVWKHREHFCEECGKELRELKRDHMHHLLPKRNGAGGYPYFRHEEMNIALLCWNCHQAAESAISYPKMKNFSIWEGIKKQLLANVGIEYEIKQK